MFTLQTMPAKDPDNLGQLAKIAGFSLHGGVFADAHQPDKLERLCRYIARPALSPQGLSDMLAITDILVSLLPLTEEIRGMINAETLAQLPKGASVINAGRGEQIVDEDLLTTLDSKHVQYAILDVFKNEPLPESHPYWSHPRVHITPHIASITRNDTAGHRLAENLLRWQRGEHMTGEVDKTRGY